MIAPGRAQPEHALPMRSISFTLPFALPSLNVRDRTHWAERHRQQERLAVEVMAAIGGPLYYPRPPFEAAIVRVVRCSSGILDNDNLAASVKSLGDVLKAHSPRNPLGLGIVVEDTPDRLEWGMSQVRAAKAETIVVIEERQFSPVPTTKAKRGVWWPAELQARGDEGRARGGAAGVFLVTDKPIYRGHLVKSGETYAGVLRDAWGWAIALTATLGEIDGQRALILTGVLGEPAPCLRFPIIDGPGPIEYAPGEGRPVDGIPEPAQP